MFITPNSYLIYPFSDFKIYKNSLFKYFDPKNSTAHRVFYSSTRNVTKQEEIYKEIENEYYLQPQGMYISYY